MSSPLALRASLIRAGRRYSRITDEVEDLAHDILLAALRRGTPIDGETFLLRASGAARRHAAFLARTAVRRKSREARWGASPTDPAPEPMEEPESSAAPLTVLSPALRTTLLLLAQGLDKDELRFALGVTDAALRKRFQALREHAPLARPRIAVPERTSAAVQVRRSQIALLPRLAVVRGVEENAEAPRIVAVHDPDGHGIIFSEVLTPARRTATTG